MNGANFIIVEVWTVLWTPKNQTKIKPPYNRLHPTEWFLLTETDTGHQLTWPVNEVRVTFRQLLGFSPSGPRFEEQSYRCPDGVLLTIINRSRFVSVFRYKPFPQNLRRSSGHIDETVIPNPTWNYYPLPKLDLKLFLPSSFCKVYLSVRPICLEGRTFFRPSYFPLPHTDHVYHLYVSVSNQPFLERTTDSWKSDDIILWY